MAAWRPRLSSYVSSNVNNSQLSGDFLEIFDHGGEIAHILFRELQWRKVHEVQIPALASGCRFHDHKKDEVCFGASSAPRIHYGTRRGKDAGIKYDQGSWKDRRSGRHVVGPVTDNRYAIERLF